MAPKLKSKSKSVVKLDGRTSTAAPRRFDPLTAFSGSISSQTREHDPLTNDIKGKGKERTKPEPILEDQMWVDKYEPRSEAELAVHVKKVEDRILALTGPAGTAKTATIRVLSREMGFEILEWRSAVGEMPGNSFGDSTISNHSDYEGPYTKFEAFMHRAASCQNIFAPAPPKPSQSSTSSSQASSQARQTRPKQHIILLEDLPNILHPKTQAQFHATLQSLVESIPSSPPVPIVIVVSDAGTRGEATEDRLASGSGWGKDRDGAVDIRTVLPKSLLGGPYVTQIAFNPIAPTLMKKALQALLNAHFPSTLGAPSKDALDLIVSTANGDIRSAIMALQFACIASQPTRGKKKGGVTVAALESITRREQSLVLFHLLGKVMYNKRKGDPPNPSASAKELQKTRDLDAQLKDPPKLPRYLKEHNRRTSRVDVDQIYADSPIDSSLFSLYIHQNYTQFCDDIQECDGVIDWLSWVDSSGGEAWYQANPHCFHLLALGTLHSLPSPVTRRSQQYYKPEFFNTLRRGREAADGVADAQQWVLQDTTSPVSVYRGGWSQAQVALELGGVLKAYDASGRSMPQGSRPPPSHRLFSNMPFSHTDAARSQPLGEKDVVDPDPAHLDDGLDVPERRVQPNAAGGWLDNDDIEEF
ncbi:Rad17 cell cycle checkpoint protein-domain-containing protein [Infundibulicybe gibba]|nr:Rad17 cell cycle checkpoint protein-domain-containing protein [Infundibulicybe gibba]